MTKIEGVPDGYELVAIAKPRKGDFVIYNFGQVIELTVDPWCGGVYPIVRKIELPKPIEPPEGYRLLTEGEIVHKDDVYFFQDKFWDEVTPEARHSIGEPWSASTNVPFARKITPKVRPMTRDEFLAAWKQRNFCPLIDPDGDIDTVSYVTDDTEFDHDCVSMFNNGWSLMDELSRFKFASDETYLTVEE